MVAPCDPQQARRREEITMPRPIALARHAGGLVAAAAIANALAAGATFFVPELLTGPVVTNAQARGTSLVMLAIGIPTLVVATWLASRGSWRGLVVVIGALAYLAYNDFLLLFATPFNPLFLVYVAAMSLTAFALATTILTTDHEAVAAHGARVPIRGIAIYAWVVVVLNTLVWLRTIVPATFAPDPTSFLEGSGVATNPVFVEDLTFWLPAAALIGGLLWLRRPLGIVLGGAWLVYGLIEAIGVGTDQWFGSTADPGSTQASMEAVVLFVTLAVIGVVPLFFYFRPERTRAASASVAGQASGAEAGAR
jgi:hypothetical protein